MRFFTNLLIAAALCVALAGCPQILDRDRFTSANPNGGWGFYGPTALDGEEVNGGQDRESAREVVEPDVIRRDGALLYVLNQYRGLTIVDLDGQQIVAQVPTYGYPRDLYLDGGRAYVLVGYATDYTVEGDTISFDVKARIYVVDVSNPAQAAVMNTFELDGDLVDSRVVGNVLYAVCAEYEWIYPGEGVAVSQAPVKAQTSSSWVTSVNMSDPSNIYEADSIDFDGYGSVIQATNYGIFVAASDWSSDVSTITYVDVSDPDGALAVRGQIDVAGRIADQYKMDAYDYGAPHGRVLRVVTSAGGWDARKVYVTTVSLADPDALTQLGQTEIEDAADETLFATRFDGLNAYVVTYFIVDPLFVVDLADPEHPRVAGALEVPGWSTHIEPMGDRLVALGVDDTDSKRRVCVSLFDVSLAPEPETPETPGQPKLLDRVSFGEDWSWSSAYNDVKALTVLDGLIIAPFSGWAHDAGGYDRLQFVAHEGDELDLRGYVDLEGGILRSFAYQGLYYGVTTEQLAQIDGGEDFSAPEVLNRLTLAEYVADFIELAPDLGVEIVVSHDAGVTRVRTVGLAKTVHDEIEVNLGSVDEAFVYGNQVVLVATHQSYYVYGPERNGAVGYKVAVVDCSDPAGLEIAAEAKIPVQPYWGGWWWYWDMPYALADKTTKQAIAPWYIPYDTGADNVFLLGDWLVLRCWEQDYDAMLGDASMRDAQGLALVDLAAPGLSYTTLGLGYENIGTLDAAGGKLYLGTQTPVNGLQFWRPPEVAHALREIDVTVPAAGAAVNVPGQYLAYDPEQDLLLLRDYQWQGPDDDLASYLRTVAWDGAGPVERLDALQLDASLGRILPRPGRVYITGYDGGLTLRAAEIGPGGAINPGAPVLVTKEWGNLLDAHGASAYVSVGNAIARYDFATGQGRLAEVLQVMGYPMSFRFGTQNAYVSLGYFGMLTLPL